MVLPASKVRTNRSNNRERSSSSRDSIQGDGVPGPTPGEQPISPREWGNRGPRRGTRSGGVAVAAAAPTPLAAGVRRLALMAPPAGEVAEMRYPRWVYEVPGVNVVRANRQRKHFLSPEGFTSHFGVYDTFDDARRALPPSDEFDHSALAD